MREVEEEEETKRKTRTKKLFNVAKIEFWVDFTLYEIRAEINVQIVVTLNGEEDALRVRLEMLCVVDSQ